MIETLRSALFSIIWSSSSTFYSCPQPQEQAARPAPNFFKDPPAIDLSEWNRQTDSLIRSLMGRNSKTGTTKKLRDLTKQLAHLPHTDRSASIGQLLWAMKLKGINNDLEQAVCLLHYVKRLPEHEQEIHSRNLKKLAVEIIRYRHDSPEDRAMSMKAFGIEEKDFFRFKSTPVNKTISEGKLAKALNADKPCVVPVASPKVSNNTYAAAYSKWQKDFEWYLTEADDPFETRNECLQSLIRDLGNLSNKARQICKQRLDEELSRQGATTLPL